MSHSRTLASITCILLGIAAALAGFAVAVPARAQYVYQCPPGYYYYPNYGCVLPGYYYAPPYYAYPDFGFDFFYGGGWGGYYRGRGIAPRGGAPHGAVSHGGGGHGGGHGGH